MTFKYSELKSPGFLLRELLMDIYPLGDLSEKIFLKRIDHDLKTEGEFIQVMYESTMNYLVRRLIRTSQYIHRLPGNSSDIRYIEELRAFLQDEFILPKGKIEALLSLIVSSVIESEKTPTQRTKDRIVRQARQNNQKCYICGCDLEFTLPNQDNSAEVDHLWPRSLGGVSDESNLVVCCRKCNQAKHDLIDASDFHYEEIIYSANDFPDEMCLRDREHRVALWSKNQHVCSYGKCKSMPIADGEFSLEKINPNDAWHYLNIHSYCPQHQTK